VVTTEFIVVGLLPEMARDLDLSTAEVEPRPVLAAVLLAFALGNLAATLVPSYPVIVAVRVVQGAALPVLVSIGSAAIAELAGRGGEGQAVALVYVGVVVAIVLALPAGVVLADAGGWQTSFVSLAILAAIASIVVGTAFPRSHTSGPASMRAQAMIIRRPAVQVHLLLSAILFAAMFAA
jgi:MFS transporter, DHA1 family, inner membrane transport protein